MPVFKETEGLKKIEKATQELIAIREVAQGRMSHPELTQERAQAIYQKYGPTIDNLINVGLQYSKNQAPEEMKESKLEFAILQIGGKSLAVLGIGRVLIGDVQSIKDAWNAPNDIIKAKEKAIQVYNNAVKSLQNDYINIGNDLAQIADAIMKDDAAKLNSVISSLTNNIKSMGRSLEKLQVAMEELGFNNATVAGATGVVKEFLAQVVITVATMGATEAAVSLVSKGLVKFASTFAGAGRLSRAVSALKDAQVAHKALEGGKAAYEAEHAAHGLGERLAKNEEQYSHAAPKIAGLK